MSLVLDAVMDFALPDVGAKEVQRLNNRLAAEPTIPEDVIAGVRELVEALAKTDRRRLESIDPHHAVILLQSTIKAQEAVTEPGSSVSRNALRIALESIRQSLAAISEREPLGDEQPTKEVARRLLAQTEVSQARLAELLGVSQRQLQRWVSEKETSEPEGEDARKVRLVARIVNQLRFVLTPAGTVEWFTWSRKDLNGQRPLDLLGDPAEEPRLIAVAAAMRSTVLG